MTKTAQRPPFPTEPYRNAVKLIPLGGRAQEKIVRRTLPSAILVGMAVHAIPAVAQDSDQFVVQSQVAPFCSELTVSSDPMNLGSLTGATGQVVSDFSGATEDERELAASFYCNAPSTVTLIAEPLVNQAVPIVGDSSSFTNRVDYTATLIWDDVSGNSVSTDSDGEVIDATEANIGSMRLRLSNPSVANNLRPVAGDYTGQVRVTVSLAQ